MASPKWPAFQHRLGVGQHKQRSAVQTQQQAAVFNMPAVLNMPVWSEQACFVHGPLPPPPAQVYEKKVTCVSDFNLQNGSSTLNTGRPALLNGSYSSEKLDLAALTAQKLGLPLRLPKVLRADPRRLVLCSCFCSLKKPSPCSCKAACKEGQLGMPSARGC